MDATGKAEAESAPSASARPWLLAALLFAVLSLAFAALWPPRTERGLRRALTTVFPLACLAVQLALLCAWRTRPAPRCGLLWFGYLVMAGAALTLPAFHSSDLHAYTQIGRLQTAYDANPYAVLASELPTWRADPFYTSTWEDQPCVYGPLFVLVARGTVCLAGDNAALARWLFRLWNVGLLALLAWWLLAWHAKPSAGRRAAGLLLSSPLLLLHFLANGHNDLLMAAGLVGAFALLRAERSLLVLPTLALAVLVKFIVLLAAPFFVLALWRRHGPGRTLASLALAALVGLLVSWPFLADLQAFRFDEISATLGRPASSLVANVLLLLGKFSGTGWPTIGPLGQGLHALLIVALIAWQLARQRRRPVTAAPEEARRALDGALVCMALVLVVTSPTFAPWYLGLLLPLGLALPEDRGLRRVLWLLGLSWTLAFTPLGRTRDLDALLMTLPVCVYALWRFRGPGPRADALASA